MPEYEVAELKGLRFTRCPVVAAKKSAYMLQAYLEYKNGFLPNAGGWLDQPMKFVDSIRLIEKQIALMKEEENAK